MFTRKVNDGVLALLSGLVLLCGTVLAVGLLTIFALEGGWLLRAVVALHGLDRLEHRLCRFDSNVELYSLMQLFLLGPVQLLEAALTVLLITVGTPSNSLFTSAIFAFSSHVEEECFLYNFVAKARKGMYKWG